MDYICMRHPGHRRNKIAIGNISPASFGNHLEFFNLQGWDNSVGNVAKN